jgi:chemotaxis protein methyltransferase WspC
MRQHDLTKKNDYLRKLDTSHSEREALIDAVVITETWFFRDRNSFQALVRLVRDKWLPTHPTGQLRVLSLPCSSGEEPYSIAMALLDMGLPAARFQIDAMDISSRALKWAGIATYGRNSFRGPDQGFRVRHFDPVPGGGHALAATVRAQVKFRKANVLDDSQMVNLKSYDVVFCRNLLIYLDRPSQQKVLFELKRLLASTGVLFLGPAEVPLALIHGFVSTNHHSSFSCRHPDCAGQHEDETSHQGTSSARQPALQSPPTLPTNLQFAPDPATAPADLSYARQLANQGRLAEAADICEAHIREHGVSADAFYLLGLVRNATGADSQASEFYRKALYLEPNHYESLMQWASLSKRNGDRDHARLLLERAGRVRKRT